MLMLLTARLIKGSRLSLLSTNKVHFDVCGRGGGHPTLVFAKIIQIDRTGV
jgi:hypothetical protein